MWIFERISSVGEAFSIFRSTNVNSLLAELSGAAVRVCLFNFHRAVIDSASLYTFGFELDLSFSAGNVLV